MGRRYSEPGSGVYLRQRESKMGLGEVMGEG